MSLATGKAQLLTATKNLLRSWEHTKTQWRDAKQVEFEKTFLESLQPVMSSAVEAIEELDRLTIRIRRDCEQ